MVASHSSTAEDARPVAGRDAGLSTRWRPGQSGNPRGKVSIVKRTEELFVAMCGDFDGELSALHREYARQAARQLARASITKDDALAVRLSNGTARLLDLIRQGRERKAVKPISAFDEYLHQRNGNGPQR